MMTPLMIVTADTQREKSQRVPQRHITGGRKRALDFDLQHLKDNILPI